MIKQVMRFRLYHAVCIHEYEQKPFDNPKVREAMSMAIDRRDHH